MNAKTLLKKSMDRSIATLLAFKDEECDPYLPDDVSADLRLMIMDEFNKLRELAIDLIGSADHVNEHYLQILAQLNKLTGGD